MNNSNKASCPLTIAIDLDGTWSADPHGFLAFHNLMTSRGHIVIIATGREKWSEDMERLSLPIGIPIVYCGRDLKEKAVRADGWSVNIWIDDIPGMIQDCRILSGSL